MAFINVSQDFISIIVGGVAFCSNKCKHNIKVISCSTSPIEKTKTNEKDNSDSNCNDNAASCSSEVFASGVNWSKNILAVCNSYKQLLLYDFSTNQLLKSFALEKQATSVSFCHFSDKVLVSDRAGFVFEFDLINDAQCTASVLGHVSMMFDLAVSPEDQHVATCDRDEKIRVSRFPNAYNIECYCLGHKKYVRSLCWMKISEQTYLVSGGGDGMIMIWNYLDGRLINSFNCLNILTHESSVQVKKIVACQLKPISFLVVIFEESSTILCLKITLDGVDFVKFDDYKILNLQNKILDADHFGEGKFLVVCTCSKKPLKSVKIFQEEFKISQIEPEICKIYNSYDQFLVALSSLNLNSQKILFDIAKERGERKKIRLDDETKTIC